MQTCDEGIEEGTHINAVMYPLEQSENDGLSAARHQREEGNINGAKESSRKKIK